MEDKRWACATMAACLILLLGTIVTYGIAEIARNHLHATKRKITATAAISTRIINNSSSSSSINGSLVVKQSNGCRRKKLGLFCGLKSSNNSSSLVDDDKRQIPTGPNPLHNR